MPLYTAHIQVFKTYETEVEAKEEINGRRPFNGDPKKKEKVTESFRVTVRADTLEKIKKKVKAHMDLIDADDLKGEG